MAALLASGVAYAEDTAKADAARLDAEFLEFLGSLDNDDEAWIGFLDAADLAETQTKVDEAQADEPKAEPKKVEDHEP